jgi:hypothetical protein
MKAMRWCLASALVMVAAPAGWAQWAELVAVQARAEVADGLARTTLVLEWATDREDDGDAEGECRIRSVSGLAAAGDLCLWISGRKEAGEVVPEARAREIYRELTDRRVDPALLSRLAPGWWDLRVFPVRKDLPRKAEVTITEPLRADGDQWVYVVPEVYDWGMDSVDFRVTCRVPAEATRVVASLAGAEVRDDPSGGAVVEFAGGADDMEHDLEIRMPREPAEGRLHVSPEGWWLTRVETSELLRPRTVVVVVDTSRSMGSWRGSWAQAAAREILQRLGPSDRFCIIQAGPQPIVLEPGLTSATQAARERVLRRLIAAPPEGAADLVGAMRAALSVLPEKTERKPDVFVVSDGVDQILGTRDGSEKTRWKHVMDRYRVHAVIFGALGWELEDLAEATGGSSVRISLEGNGPWSSWPSFSDIQWLVTMAFEREPSRVSLVGLEPNAPAGLVGCLDMDDGKTIWVAGDSLANAGETLEIELSRGREHVRVRRRVPEKSAVSELVAKPAAVVLCGDLVGRIRSGRASPEHMYRLGRLSREARTTTAASNMLVLENEQQYRQYGIVRTRPGKGKLEPLAEPDALAITRLEKLRAMVRLERQDVQGLGELVSAVGQYDPQLAQRATLLRAYAQLRQSVATKRQRRRELAARIAAKGGLGSLSADAPLELPPLRLGAVVARAIHAKPAEDPKTVAALRTAKVRLDGKPIAAEALLHKVTDAAKVDLALSRDLLLTAGARLDRKLELPEGSYGALELLEITLEGISPAASGEDAAGYHVASAGVVSVAPTSILDRDAIPRVYNVTDLVGYPTYRHREPLIYVGSLDGVTASSGSMWDNDEGGIFGDDAFGDDDRDVPRAPSRESNIGIGAGMATELRPVDDDDDATGILEDSVRDLVVPDRDEGSIFGDSDARSGRNDDSAFEHQLVEAVKTLVSLNRGDMWESGKLAVFDGLLTVRELNLHHGDIEELLKRLRRQMVAPDSEPAWRDEALVPAEITKKLNAKIASFEVEQMPLEDVFDLWRRISGLRLWVEWLWLNNCGHQRSTRVTVSLHNATAREVLETVLERVDRRTPGWEGNPLGWDYQTGLIRVSTLAALVRPITRVYDVRGIVQAAKSSAPGADSAEGFTLADERFDSLLAFMGSVLERDVDDSLSSLGRGHVVVSASRREHRRLQALLAKVRAARGATKVHVFRAEPYWPETAFTLDSRIRPWMVALLADAQADALAGHSTIEVRQVGKRRLARIGGIWMDTSLDGHDVITPIPRHGSVATRILTGRDELRKAVGAGSHVILRLAPGCAVSFEPDAPPVAQETAREILGCLRDAQATD